MLAVDIGNTFTRFAHFSGETLVDKRSVPTRDLDSQTVETAITSLNGHDRIWIASVVPAGTEKIRAAAEALHIDCRTIDSARDCIIENKLTTPETTGVDRLLSAMAAGQRHFRGGVGADGYVVIQCGSAVTVDVVDKDTVFVGGVILPGPSMWLSSMASAAQLPDLSARLPQWNDIEPGVNTRDAMLHGMHIALPEAVAATARRLGGTRPVVLTGGWSDAVVPLIKGTVVQDPDLLLHGIRLFAERNGNV